MRGGIYNWSVPLCAVLLAALPALGKTGTFADLLALAQAQAAAGHRWAPPGDNMTETVVSMMELVPTATPAQIAQLSALLDSDAPVPATAASNSGALVDRPAAQITSGIVTPASEAVRVFATTVPTLKPAPREGSGSDGNAGDPSNLHGQGEFGASQAPSGTGSRTGLLFARGLDAEVHGDFSGARRFYQSAAQRGDAAAARNLGRLYDPGYLRQTALGGVDPDPALARTWYERAVRLGDAEAVPLLEALSVR
jgi:TPR repeat protein